MQKISELKNNHLFRLKGTILIEICVVMGIMAIVAPILIIELQQTFESIWKSIALNQQLTEHMGIYHRLITDFRGVMNSDIDCNNKVIIGPAEYKIKSGRVWRKGAKNVPRYLVKHDHFGSIECIKNGSNLTIVISLKDKEWKIVLQ